MNWSWLNRIFSGKEFRGIEFHREKHVNTKRKEKGKRKKQKIMRKIVKMSRRINRGKK